VFNVLLIRLSAPVALVTSATRDLLTAATTVDHNVLWVAKLVVSNVSAA
jgi:hypothetical protein